jgi:hypothetical protein
VLVKTVGQDRLELSDLSVEGAEQLDEGGGARCVGSGESGAGFELWGTQDCWMAVARSSM